MRCRFGNLDGLHLFCGQANIVRGISIRLKGGETGDGGVWHVTFDAILRADFHIIRKALDNFDALAAFQLRVHIEAIQRIVDPDLIVTGIAFERCGTGPCGSGEKRQADRTEKQNK